jgi:hypothetical protein
MFHTLLHAYQQLRDKVHICLGILGSVIERQN